MASTSRHSAQQRATVSSRSEQAFGNSSASMLRDKSSSLVPLNAKTRKDRQCCRTCFMVDSNGSGFKEHFKARKAVHCDKPLHAACTKSGSGISTTRKSEQRTSTCFKASGFGAPVITHSLMPASGPEPGDPLPPPATISAFHISVRTLAVAAFQSVPLLLAHASKTLAVVADIVTRTAPLTRHHRRHTKAASIFESSHCRTASAAGLFVRKRRPHQALHGHNLAHSRHTKAAGPCSGTNCRTSAAAQSGKGCFEETSICNDGSKLLNVNRNVACASLTAAKTCPRSTSVAVSAPNTARLALSANASEHNVSCACFCSGATQTHSKTLPWEPKNGSNNLVSRQARYGK
mmetsp:Transcript_33196/g.60865  ORF Transcript_33196/g.60865 Transcript_33196/m.60865 type:complete len:348 (-) Transcript_33196:1397-2440(-)